MRISDWSSDVCSSDLVVGLRVPGPGLQRLDVPDVALDLVVQDQRVALVLARERGGVDGVEPGEDRLVEIDSRLEALGPELFEPVGMAVVADLGRVDRRSKKRRVGQEGDSTGKTRWTPAKVK